MIKRIAIKIWKNKIWTFIGISIGVISTIITLSIYAGNSWEWLKKTFFDDITINCPDEIFSYEHKLTGTYSPHKNRFVRIYISPRPRHENDDRSYWLQSPKTEPDGSWSFVARFGNPFWHGMRGNPPLKYEIIAVLYKDQNNIFGKSNSSIIIKEGEDILTSLEKHGATAYKICSINRNDEIGCNFMPKILNPLPPENPRLEPEVVSPIEIKWSPNQRMWVELWKDGNEVKEHPNGFYNNYFLASLQTGLYELKVKEQQHTRCVASTWFRVVNSSNHNGITMQINTDW